ncbi:hypothetical protein D479_17239 [Halobacillus sp. BAB-2008]|nr:hypothetical protein D479_17239 [Halobacillus sp. BAB-2008]
MFMWIILEIVKAMKRRVGRADASQRTPAAGNGVGGYLLNQISEPLIGTIQGMIRTGAPVTEQGYKQTQSLSYLKRSVW